MNLEKFALLNLLKALDGIKNLSGGENGNKSAENSPTAPDAPKRQDQPPNILYETLVKHEQVSNRLKNKRN